MTLSIHTLLFNILLLFEHKLRDTRGLHEVRAKLRIDRLVSRVFMHFFTLTAEESNGSKIGEYFGVCTTPSVLDMWDHKPVVIGVNVETPVEPLKSSRRPLVYRGTFPVSTSNSSPTAVSDDQAQTDGNGKDDGRGGSVKEW